MTRMMWHDNSNRPTDVRIMDAVKYFENKYGVKATVCFIHPNTVKDIPNVPGIKVLAATNLLNNHFWIGDE